MPAHHMPGVGMAQNQPMQQQINLEVPNEVRIDESGSKRYNVQPGFAVALMSLTLLCMLPH